MSERRTDDATLIAAVRILSRTIQTEDGVIPACLAEAAARLETLVEERRSITTLLGKVESLEADNKRLREERQWVPVGERLPEEGIEALWWCNSDDQDRGVYVGKRDRSLIVWGSHEWFIDADFTHWMPLPPGPEANG